MITRDQVINDVIQVYPETTAVFHRFSVDACCGGAHSIAETAGGQGLQGLTPLLNALNREARRLGEKPLAQVIEEIEATHHVYLHQEIPALLELLARLVDKTEGEPAVGRALALRRALSVLAAELSDHLLIEERILFPTIRRIEAAPGGQESTDGFIAGWDMKGYIAQMHLEHEQAKRGLDRVREALEALEETGKVAEATVTLRPRLERLHDDLMEHFRAEEEDLFPRALNLESEALARMDQSVDA